MKKILIAVILFCSLGGYAQINIKQGFGIEYFTNNKTQMMQDVKLSPMIGRDVIIFNKGSMSCLYKIKAEYKSFSIKALTSIYMNKAKSYQFAPTHAEFTINLTYKLSKLSFKVEHQCVHDIISQKIPPVRLQGGYTKFGVYFNW